jgi:hypothetical protein
MWQPPQWKKDYCCGFTKTFRSSGGAYGDLTESYREKVRHHRALGLNLDSYVCGDVVLRLKQ